MTTTHYNTHKKGNVLSDERIPTSWEEVTSPMAARVLALGLAVQRGEETPSVGTWHDAQRLASVLRIRGLVKPPKEADFIEPEVRPAYKLIKDGGIWDYSDLREYMEALRNKILREEPEARVEIRDCTGEEMLSWKEGVW